jgi:hypothetical protein
LPNAFSGAEELVPLLERCVTVGKMLRGMIRSIQEKL